VVRRDSNSDTDEIARVLRVEGSWRWIAELLATEARAYRGGLNSLFLLLFCDPSQDAWWADFVRKDDEREHCGLSCSRTGCDLLESLTAIPPLIYEDQQMKCRLKPPRCDAAL